MKFHLRLLRLLLAAVCLQGTATLQAADSSVAPSFAVIPQPAAIERGEGVFPITSASSLHADGVAKAEAERLLDALAPAMGFRLELVDGAPAESGAIVLSLDESLSQELGPEGYQLRVTPKRIDLRAADSAGLFYAIQTLRQLLPTEIFSPNRVVGFEWSVPCVTITDQPRFAWRGLLIDPARHFIPVADVKHFIDAMALHKFNRLQMHLTDNEGWRVEIKKYPHLTELGSKMDWNLRHRSGDGPRCQGFYSQDDIRELVRYAAERHITIVPEIEMPYHAGSAIVAYPEHGVNTKGLAELPLEQRWGPSKGLLGPRPETVAFMQDILAEVIELFPSRFIHIGGDEANLQLWTDDAEMQAMMKQLGCADAHAVAQLVHQADGRLPGGERATDDRLGRDSPGRPGPRRHGDELAWNRRRDHRGPGWTRRHHGTHLAHLLRLPPASRRTRARWERHHR